MPTSIRRARRGFIRCYGLFWSADQVEWFPGRGRREFRLLGHRGENRPNLVLCDFRDQRGIYVLYDDYGPYYVGLTRDRPIGNRLRHHRRDRHAGKWDRFSWFGFRRVLLTTEGGLRQLGAAPKQLLTESKWTIGDIEALLIQSLGTQHRGNRQEMRFAAAQPWTQVILGEVPHYLARVGKT